MRATRSRSIRCVVAALTALTAGCSPTDVDAPPPPAIDTTAVTPGPHNVLSAIVSVRVRGADSVAVRFRPSAESSASDSITAAVAATSDSLAIPVLGLLPGQRYAVRVVAYGRGGNTFGNVFEFTTGRLPPDLPAYTATGDDPAPGYVVFAAGVYGIVIDNSGSVVWYRRFPDGPGLNFMAQPNGRYVAKPVTPDPTDIEPWLELDALGNITRSVSCANGLRARFHDVIAQPDGSYWLLCDETRVMDLSAVGGVAQAQVTGTAVQHIAPNGSLRFQWSPFGFFSITDVDISERAGVNVNWTHGNALDIDADGNLVVSFRNLDEITKIHVPTGAVMWRLGGRRNQFRFDSNTTAPFIHQHGARAFNTIAVLLLDNTGEPGESRVERYELDLTNRSARLVRSYSAGPGVVTPIGGSVQQLPGGHTLASFGIAGRVEEYDANGRVVWRIEGHAGYVFRAQRITSLYAPGIGLSR